MDDCVKTFKFDDNKNIKEYKLNTVAYDKLEFNNIIIGKP